MSSFLYFIIAIIIVAFFSIISYTLGYILAEVKYKNIRYKEYRKLKELFDTDKIGPL